MTKRTEQCQGAPSSLIFAVERRPSLKIEKKRKDVNEIKKAVQTPRDNATAGKKEV